MLLQEFGIDSSGSLDGIKIAQVVSNADPKCQERVLVRVMGVHNMENDIYENGVWAHHCAPFRDSSGDLPEKYDYVYVIFPDKKDPMSILWLGFVRSSYQNDGRTVGELLDEPHGILGKIDYLKESDIEQ